jgi:hypothetical protein
VFSCAASLEAEYILDRKKLLIVKASKLRNFGLPGAARANQFTDNKKSLALLISPLLETSSCSSHVPEYQWPEEGYKKPKKCEHNHEREADSLQVNFCCYHQLSYPNGHVSYILLHDVLARLNIILNIDI